MLPRPAPSPSLGAGPIRVLVIDDSAVVRGLMNRWIGREHDMDLAGVAADGEEGLRQAERLKPDVIVLDVEMPRLDGLTALPQLRKIAPHARIVMASTLTRRNAEITMKALAEGASDYVAKPAVTALAGAEAYRRELLDKVRALGRAAKPRAAALPAASALRPVGPRPPVSRTRPEAVFIGASTGGPQALRAVIGALGGQRAPLLITQHMPATFTTILAEHLDKTSARKVVEARDGMPVNAGHGYVAPGDHHMTVRRRGSSLSIVLDQRPPENFCRPAVDPLFRSAAAACGAATLAVVLTGMGQDGAAGAADIVNAGGSVIVQDEASSVVWGMPGAVEKAGLAAAMRPLSGIAAAVTDVLIGKAL